MSMDIVAELREGAANVERARNRAVVEYLAGWEQRIMREAAAEIERLRAELDARDGEIADWLRVMAEEIEPFGMNRIEGPWPFLETAADAIEAKAYRAP